MKRLILLAVVLSGCSSMSSVPSRPANPAVVAKIVAACTARGLFRPVIVAGETVAEAAVPVAALPIGLVRAGVDLVCANPSRFAADISTVEWVAKNIAGATS